MGWPTRAPLEGPWWQSLSDGFASRSTSDDTPPKIEAVLYLRDGQWYAAARLAHRFSSNTYDEDVYRLKLAWPGLSAWKVTPAEPAHPFLQVEVSTSPDNLRRTSNSVEEASTLLGAADQLLDFLRQVSGDA